MAPRLSGQKRIFFKFLLSLNSQKRREYKENPTKYRSLPERLRSTLEYRYIERGLLLLVVFERMVARCHLARAISSIILRNHYTLVAYYLCWIIYPLKYPRMPLF